MNLPRLIVNVKLQAGEESPSERLSRFTAGFAKPAPCRALNEIDGESFPPHPRSK
jgi:hypothetical protein